MKPDMIREGGVSLWVVPVVRNVGISHREFFGLIWPEEIRPQICIRVIFLDGGNFQGDLFVS